MGADRLCLLDDKRKGKTRSLRAFFSPPMYRLDLSICVSMYLSIYVSIVCSQKKSPFSRVNHWKITSCSAARSPHMCKINAKISFAKKGKPKKQFLSIFECALRHKRERAGKWSLTGERSQTPISIPTTHKVPRQICIAGEKTDPQKLKPKRELNATFPFSGSPLDSCQKSLANILSVGERES